MPIVSGNLGVTIFNGLVSNPVDQLQGHPFLRKLSYPEGKRVPVALRPLPSSKYAVALAEGRLPMPVVTRSSPSRLWTQDTQS